MHQTHDKRCAECPCARSVAEYARRKGASFAQALALLQKAMDLLGVKASKEIAMIGDRHFDMEAAVAIGVSAIGVSYGFGSEEELKNAGADQIAKTVQELRSMLLEEG